MQSGSNPEMNNYSVDKNQPRAWKERIVNGAGKILEAEILLKADSLKIDEELKGQALQAVKELLADENFIEQRLMTGQWPERLEKDNDPEDTENKLAKGLALAIKDALKNKGFNDLF